MPHIIRQVVTTIYNNNWPINKFLIELIYTFTDLVIDIETNPVDAHLHEQTHLGMNLLQITDYSPEWAFPEVCNL